MVQLMLEHAARDTIQGPDHDILKYKRTISKTPCKSSSARSLTIVDEGINLVVLVSRLLRHRKQRVAALFLVSPANHTGG